VRAYTPGQRRKKKPRMSLSTMVFICAVLARWHNMAAQAIIGKGIGFTLKGGGSCLAQADN
jgi:hypothetical protein